MQSAVDGLKISQEEVDALKQRHGKVFRGVISVTDKEGDKRNVVFLHRAPRHKDSEAMALKARTNPAAADRNLLAGVIVYPAPADVLEALRDAPAAVGAFVGDELLPFLGSRNEVESAEI